MQFKRNFAADVLNEFYILIQLEIAVFVNFNNLENKLKVNNTSYSHIPIVACTSYIEINILKMLIKYVKLYLYK